MTRLDRVQRLTWDEGAECVYEAKEGKPGLKPGAVELLNRRVGKCKQRGSKQTHC